MKKGDRVKILNGLPTELKGLKKPILGTIQSLSDHSAIVKPRYQRHSYIITLGNLEVISEEEFHKKQKHPHKPKKRKSFKQALIDTAPCTTKSKLEELTTKTIAKAKYGEIVTPQIDLLIGEDKPVEKDIPVCPSPEEPEVVVFPTAVDSEITSREWLKDEKEHYEEALREEHSQIPSAVYWAIGVVVIATAYLIIKLWM